MASYELTPYADTDLEDIARYTILEWSIQQAKLYLDKLHGHFGKIASKNITPKTFSKQFPQLLVTRCEFHYVFYLHSKNSKPIILAVLHERMDIVNRLKERFE